MEFETMRPIAEAAHVLRDCVALIVLIVLILWSVETLRAKFGVKRGHLPKE